MQQEEFIRRFSYNPTSDMLGSGGFGKVFKAWDNEAECYVAIKMQSVDARYPGLRLSDEVKKGARLRHPNVARYKECFTFETMDGTKDVAIMSYYEDGSLDKLLASGGLSREEQYSLLTEILEGIAYLHHEGIIHRDLKPQNILILHNQDRYIPKITDFGISKQLDDGQSSAVSNSVLGGTRSYASPEQLKERTIRKNTDLWSFGVIAYQMLVGSLPFNCGAYSTTSEEGRQEMFRQMMSGVLPEALGDVPEPWQHLIRECLTVDNERRIAHADDCLAIIREGVKTAVDVELKPIVETALEHEEKVEEAEPIAIPVEAAEAIPTPKPQPQPEVKVDVKPEPKPQPKPEVKASPNSPSKPAYRSVIQQEPENKRSKWWLWLLLLVAVAGGAFVWFNSQPKDNPESVNKPTDEVADSLALADEIEPTDGEEVVVPAVPEPEPEPEPEPTPVPDPVLRLTSNSSVTVAHGGGNGEIGYTLENPVSGRSVSVNDNANWLTTSKSGNKVTYSATANESQSPREATITVSYGDQSFEVAVTQSGKPAPTPTQSQATQPAESTPATRGNINGHEWVDLGLPSGLKWATCNVGASNPGDYGNYYAWGETSPAPNNNYSENNCSAYRQSIGDIAGTSRDAARANWGGSWRMPRKAEIDELLNNCTWTWTTQNGHNGYRVTGPNGNSIFLPAAGWRYGTSSYDVGSYGYYWSSTPYESDTQYAYSLHFHSGSQYRYWYYRLYGRSVRPVSE